MNPDAAEVPSGDAARILKVLLIEDYEDDALLVLRALRRGGFSPQAEVIENVRQLESALEQSEWDVVITDYLLPDFTGLEALGVVRERGLDIPVIVVSGAIGEDMAVASMRAGANDYVMKDNLVRLAEAVRRELGETSVRRARRAAEQALKQSEARYRAIVEDQTDLVVRWYPDGTRTFVNRAYCNYFEASREKLLGGDHFAHIATADRPGVRDKISRLTPAHPVATDEHRVIHPGGHLAWHESVDRGIFDEAGRLVELQSVSRDVTARRRVAEVERQQLLLVEVLRDTAAILSNTLDLEEVFDRILNNIGWVIPHDTAAILLIEDRQTTVIRQRGWAEQGLSPLPPHFELKPTERSALDQIIAGGRPVSIRNTAEDPRWRRGSERLSWVESLAAAPLFDEGRVRGLLTLFSATSDHFSPTHMELLEGFANAAAAAIRNARLFQAVSDGRRELRELSAQVVEAQEEERRRISRELHDEVGQNLTVMIMSADFIVEQYAAQCPERVIHHLKEMSSMARGVLEQIRGLSHRLRPGILDELGLVPTLRWLSDSFSERTGLPVELEIGEGPEKRLAPALEITLYRAVQEGLTNAVRHAQATSVQVSLQQDGTDVHLTIEDDGVGLEATHREDEHHTGIGLLGMRERVGRLGGTLRIHSGSSGGTTVHVQIPLQ